MPGKGVDHSLSPEAGREGTKPKSWVSWAAKRQNMSGLAPAGCSLGLVDRVLEPGSHPLGTAVQGKTGRGGESHSWAERVSSGLVPVHLGSQCSPQVLSQARTSLVV